MDIAVDLRIWADETRNSDDRETLKIAADEIEQLSAKVAELEKDDWISVDDRLPDWVKIYDEPLEYVGEELPPLYETERVLIVCNGVVKFDRIRRLGDCTIMPFGLTHWKPLPQPPQAMKDSD